MPRQQATELATRKFGRLLLAQRVYASGSHGPLSDGNKRMMTYKIHMSNGGVRYITCWPKHLSWHMRCIGFSEINREQTRYPDFVEMLGNLLWNEVR